MDGCLSTKVPNRRIKLMAQKSSIVETFPRLCYLGPAIEATVGGSALLYKLFQDYPPHNLIAFEASTRQSACGGRLKDVHTIMLPAAPPWGGPRGRTIYDMFFLFGRVFWGRWCAKKIRNFRPEAVVCVI